LAPTEPVERPFVERRRYRLHDTNSAKPSLNGSIQFGCGNWHPPAPEEEMEQDRLINVAMVSRLAGVGMSSDGLARIADSVQLPLLRTPDESAPESRVELCPV